MTKCDSSRWILIAVDIGNTIWFSIRREEEVAAKISFPGLKIMSKARLKARRNILQ